VTNNSKGVLLSHAGISARADAAIVALDLRAGDVMMWVLSLAYHFAVSVGACIRAGVCIVFAASIRPRQSAGIAREAQVTHAYLSPPIAMALSRLPDLDLGPALRQVLVTTAAIDASAADELRQRLGVPVRQALGIIEVGLPLLSPGVLGEPAGQLGAPAPGYAVRIRHQSGRDLGIAERGELCIRGPGLFAAYLDPWQDASAILDDGYFATGDAACLDADGRVQLLGRLKSLINIGGVKVFPLPVEAVLCAHPAVAQAKVYGECDERGGEILVASIELCSPFVANAALGEDLSNHCRSLLAPLECPSKWVFEQLPLTPSGKVVRSPSMP
jgi:acyl-coenzyme A synthetase/AMP-(fatty) acid ligase